MKQDFKDLLRALYDEFGDEGIEFVKNQGACDASVGHVRPGRVGRCPPRVSMARAMSA